MPLPQLLREMLSLPTAAFAESAVMDYIHRLCGQLRGVSVTRDRYGNLLAHYASAAARPAPVLAAHTDHPGFVALAMRDGKAVRAAFRGWVEPEYFASAKVRFWSQDRWVKGLVTRVVKTAPVYGLIGRTGRPEEVEVAVRRPVRPGSPGMWDLPDPTLRGDRIYARGCDDIAGCAALLATLERLSRRKARAAAYCLFTRAEEVGFVGAIAAARARTIPRGCPVVAIETSKALPNARIGDGPILRVGDKASVFTPSVTRFCEHVAKQLAHDNPGFRWQRKLMDGGTCESTAYLAYGYPTTGICVALGNYHNMDTRRKKIASEYISLSDWHSMVDWFEALARTDRGFGEDERALRESLDQRFASYATLL